MRVHASRECTETVSRRYLYNAGTTAKASTFRQIIDVVFVCACGPPGGGRQSLSARFPRHFNTVGYTAMQDSSMQRIFKTILGNFLAAPGWEDEVKALANGVVDSTIEIYNTILRDLRPTPAKSHYQFNLRDISKVFQGVLMVLPAKFKTAAEFHTLIYARKSANFRRSTDQPGGPYVWFDELLLKCTKEHCGFDSVEKCVIADFMVTQADPRIYEEVSDMSQLQPTIEEYLNDYNGEQAADAARHYVRKSTSESRLCVRARPSVVSTKKRLSRKKNHRIEVDTHALRPRETPFEAQCISTQARHVHGRDLARRAHHARPGASPRATCCSWASAGAGGQSLSRLSTFMAECKIFSIEITKGYGLSEWC